MSVSVFQRITVFCQNVQQEATIVFSRCTAQAEHEIENYISCAQCMSSLLLVRTSRLAKLQITEIQLMLTFNMMLELFVVVVVVVCVSQFAGVKLRNVIREEKDRFFAIRGGS